MFETHLDATYAWIGLAVVSVAAVGVAAAFPAAPAPDADGVARTVDSIAGGEYPATAEHGIAAERIRLTDGSVSLGDERGSARTNDHTDHVRRRLQGGALTVPKHSAEVRTTHADAATVAAAVAPDNTASMTTRVDGDAVVTSIRRSRPGGLQSSLDDYVVNLTVAATVTDTAATYTP